MSFETVKKRCIERNPGGDSSRLDSSILESMRKFEKLAKSQTGGYIPLSFHAMTAEEGETAWQVANKHFDKHKLEYVHMYLEMLIDLYDYKPECSLKKST